MFVAVWTKTRRCGGACSDGTRTRRQIIYLSDARAARCSAGRDARGGVSFLPQVCPTYSIRPTVQKSIQWQGLFALYQPTSFPLARPHSLLPVNASKRGRRPVLRGESNPREWRSCGFGALARVSAISRAKTRGTKTRPTKRHNRSTSTHTRPSERMLHCVSFFSAGFSLAGPTSHVKLHSAAVPLSRSSVPFAAAAAADNVDEVELRFRDLEVTKERAPEVLALMEEHSFPLGLAQRAVES